MSLCGSEPVAGERAAGRGTGSLRQTPARARLVRRAGVGEGWGWHWGGCFAEPCGLFSEGKLLFKKRKQKIQT